VCSKVVLLELLAGCDVDTLRDCVALLLFAVVDGLKRLVSLKPLSGQRDRSYLKICYFIRNLSSSLYHSQFLKSVFRPYISILATGLLEYLLKYRILYAKACKIDLVSAIGMRSVVHIF
jgi:hypothetical protein